ncbi:MAG: threonine synthase [Firmicutes bacterium]|jgi:threonine synthase|nr:threonine synthase [Bacillota bacterium]
MGRVAELRCVLCGRSFGEGEVEYTCPHCGNDGTLDVLYDYEKARAEMSRAGLASEAPGMWRYRAILPVSRAEHVQALAVGWTPLYRSDRLAAEYGVKRLFIKDEGRNPTGSLKDRASAVGVGRAVELGRRAIACASTGNAASSLAGFSAITGLDAFIFVPRTAPEAKVTQLLVYDAAVVLVDGTYEDAFNLSAEAVEEFGWYNRNCGINPYLLEGKKTCALEIAEQLDWNAPDWVFIAVGDGCCIGGLYKGFSEMVSLGLIERMPRLCGVQAEGCRPIQRAFVEEDSKVRPETAHTIADSIAVGRPRNWAKALRAVRNSGGRMVTVTDEEILSAIGGLARRTGVFGEPAGVAGFAGFCKMAREGMLRADDSVVVVVTGNGLKDIATARRACREPITSEPRLEGIRCLTRAGGPGGK